MYCCGTTVVESTLFTGTRSSVVELAAYLRILVIGAIGGTMSLCIGFSFRDFNKWALTQLEIVYERTLIKYRLSNKIERKKDRTTNAADSRISRPQSNQRTIEHRLSKNEVGIKKLSQKFVRLETTLANILEEMHSINKRQGTS